MLSFLNNKNILIKSIFLIIFALLISSQAFAGKGKYDGKWYGTNPCAYFDEAQDVTLVIENDIAKVDWGEKHKETKYRGKIYKRDKLGLNSNAGRVEGEFMSQEELILNEDVTFTNSSDETIDCEFTLTKNEIKKEDDTETADTNVESGEDEASTDFNVSIENLPDWFLNPPDGGNLLKFFVGEGESVTIQAAKDFAIEEALENFGSTIQRGLQQEVNKMVDQVGLGNDLKLTREMTEVTISTTQQVQVGGWMLDKTAVLQHETTSNYFVYVLLKIPNIVINKIFLQQLNAKNESKEKIKVSKAFQELEEEINNSS